VTIQKPVESVHDSYGATNTTWNTHATRWAKVMPQGGREYYAASQIHAEMTHLLEMNYVSGIAPTMRVALGTRYLAIVSAADLEEQHVTHQLVCKEVV